LRYQMPLSILACTVSYVGFPRDNKNCFSGSSIE
jgi:hypothetical protein